MASLLQYPPDFYKIKLSEYAKDTIEYHSISGLWDGFVNQKGKEIVVEEHQDKFKIYRDNSSKYSSRDNDSLEIFYVIVRFSDGEMSFDVVLTRLAKIIFGFVALIILIVGLHSLLYSSFYDVVKIVIGILILVNWLLRDKKLFKNQIVKFLNSIAKS